jgi:uncharacterized protein YggE
MDKGVQITLIIVGGILLLALFAGLAVYNLIPGQYKGTTVNVDGASTIKATPDVVKIYFNMETNASTSSEATSLNAQQVEDMTIALIRVGLERKQIQTQNFNVYQWTDWENGRSVDKGFKASHQIIVELSTNQFSLVGQVIDAGADAEAMISYINFELSQDKQNEYKALAFKQAAEDARVKAESIADGLNKRVGDIVSVSTQNWNYNPWPIYYATASSGAMENVAMAKQATTDITPSTEEVTGQVSVVYQLR